MVGTSACEISHNRKRRGVLLASIVLAVLLMALPGQAFAAQQVSGTAQGQLTVTVQTDDGGSQTGGDGSSQPGGSGSQTEGSGSQSGASAMASTGDATALAVAGALALMAGGAYVVLRSRRTATANGAHAANGTAKDVVAVGAAAVLAAALLFSASATRAMAGDDEDAQRATVSATMMVDAQGKVLSSAITFNDNCASPLTVTGVSVAEMGGAQANALDGQKAAANASVEGSFSVTSIPAELLEKAKAAGGTVSVDMTADYTYNVVTVTINAGNGSDATTQTVAEGGLLAEPAVPTWMGHTFTGWYSDEALTQAWDFATSTAPADDFTLYGAWSLDAYTVTFHANGHGSGDTTQSVDFGSTAEDPGLTDTAYHVIGWYANAECTGDPYDFATLVNSNIDLYAKWEINTYSVTFNANGGTPEPAAQTVNYGDKASKPETDPTKQDCIFKGWYSDAGFVVEADFDQAITMDTTFYAKWADTVKVSYDLDYKDAPSIDAAIIEKGTSVSDLPAPERKGYEFAGWYVDDSDTQATADTTFDVDTTLKAKWTPAATTYTVELYEDLEDGSAYNEKPTITDVVAGVTGQSTNYTEPTYEGYTLAQGVTQQTIKGDGSTVLQAYYKRNVYTVNFDLQGHGDAIDPIQVRYDAHATKQKPADPVAEGWIFEGWYVDQACTTAVQWDTDTMGHYPDGLTLYAKWAAKSGIKYTIERWIDNTDGTYRKYMSEEYYGTAGATIEVPTVYYRGYTAQKVADTTIDGSGTTVVQVKYDRNKHTLTYNAMGKAADKTVENVYYDRTPEKYTPTAEGYTFEGWYKDKDFTQPWDSEYGSMPDKDLTLYAKWSPAVDTKYTVKHYQQNTTGDGYTLVETETLTGITGEQTAAKAKSYDGFNEPTVTQQEIAANGKTVIEIKYDRKTLDVQIVTSDGSTVSQTVLCGATAKEPATQTEVDDQGYFQDGWTVNLGDKLAIFDFSTPITADLANDNGVVKIEALKLLLSDSYWIAPASSITTSNSSVQVANANYINPETGIAKSRTQIQSDVEKIAAGDSATIAEYTAYMNNDNYHLYTKVGTGTSTNDYAEFRIIQVGSHDGDGSSLTFQATSATDQSCMNDSATNNGGWATSWLHNSMNNTWGSTYQKYATALTDDMMAVAKKSLSPKSTSWVYAEELTTTFDKMWLPSWSEVYSIESASSLTSASRSTFTSQYTYEGSQYDYYKNIGVTSDKSNSANAALDPLTKFRDGSNGEGSLLRTAAIESGDTYAQIAFNGTGRDGDTTRPGYAGAATMKRVAPCFSFGNTSTHTVKFVTNGGSAVEAQQVVNGSTVSGATTTQDGKEFVGWYTDAALTKPYVLGATPVTADTVLYARWTDAESSVTDSYWLGDAYLYTNGNSDAAANNVYNEYAGMSPQNYVKKNRAQILFDMSRLHADDSAAKVEYTYYMLTDTVHLYSKSRDNAAYDNYNEFRIVDVGIDSFQATAITFQLANSWYAAGAIGWESIAWHTYNSWGFGTSSMASQFSNQGATMVGEKLYADMTSARKKWAYSFISNGRLWAPIRASYWKLWLASVDEMIGYCDYAKDVNGAVYPEEGSQFQYYQWHGVSLSNSENPMISALYRCRSRSLLDGVSSDCTTDYVLWTRSVVPDGLLVDFGDSYRHGMLAYAAFNNKGVLNYDACKNNTKYDLKLLYSPCFCF